MRKIFLLLSFVGCFQFLFAQQPYWIFFTDKENVSFDPYTYFDEKAIERRIQNNLSLYDLSDYPLNSYYSSTIASLSEEVIGESRWFNAMAVFATDEAVTQIYSYPFVASILPICNDADLASVHVGNVEMINDEVVEKLLKQVKRFKGEWFDKHQIDGSGVRVAVFDGGFPGVNTHPAFAHLRDNHLIIKTWNFPLKKENVYGWNSHGTMVLSCIAGMEKGAKMGLATGSEFLLARTEVGFELAREEVWWLEAVEWADKNGADVINSSLGYGKSRYNPKDMDGQKSLVSRAANMAAAKGMLVCNAMGNEGMDRAWRVLITPADADSILSVGGIDPETNRHILFSSYGPTADGRMKPNVCAFGTARVASPRDRYKSASGTSFASPLVAGFAACAWQTNREWTAMELKTEIEKSADHYPYFDYAYGYGVPQADYFFKIEQEEEVKSEVIRFFQNENIIFITVTPLLGHKNILLANIQNEAGKLEAYWEIHFKEEVLSTFKIDKKRLKEGDIITARFHNEVATFRYGIDEVEPYENEKMKYQNSSYLVKIWNGPALNYKTSSFGPLAKYYVHPYVTLGFVTPPLQIDSTYTLLYGNSHSSFFGIRLKGNVCKWYNLGINLEIGKNSYRVKNFADDLKEYDKERLKFFALNLEFYQRFRLASSELFGLGLYFDTGIYGSWIFKNQLFQEKKSGNVVETKTTKKLDYILPLQWGVKARLGFELIAIYAQYRISDIFKDKKELPKPEVGIEISIPMSL